MKLSLCDTPQPLPLQVSTVSRRINSSLLVKGLNKHLKFQFDLFLISKLTGLCKSSSAFTYPAFIEIGLVCLALGES